MKRFILLCLCISVCLTLFSGCEPGVAAAPDIRIHVGDVATGMAVSAVDVYVTFDNQPVACRFQWSAMGSDGQCQYLREENTIPAGCDIRLDLYYVLPKGVQPVDLPITMDSTSCVHEGTEAAGTGSDGGIEAWTRIRVQPTQAPLDVVITAGEVAPGTPVAEIPVSVTVNGEDTECEPVWICYEEDSYHYLEGADTIPDAYYGRLDVYYYLPAGRLVEEASITVNAPGGIDDGTGDVGTDELGRVRAWSHIQYDMVPDTAEVVVTVGEVLSGMTVKDIPIVVTVNAEEVPYTAQWTNFGDQDYRVMADTDRIPEDFYGRVDISYSLPKGFTGANIAAQVNAPAGNHEGTGETGTDEQGQVIALTRIGYGVEPPHVHKWNKNESLSKAATCDQSGWDQMECRCGETYQEKTSPKGHNYSKSTTDRQPTCSSAGSRTVSCSRCGDSYQESVPATGHKYSQAQTIKSADCTHSGTRKVSCSGCGDSYEEPIPALGHDWSAWEYQGSYHSRTCKRCGATEEGDHVFPDLFTSKCSLCNGDIIN